MYEDLIKRLRISAQLADKGLITPPGICLEAADAIEHMQKTIVRLENELGIYDDLPMVYQIEKPEDESAVLSKTEKTTQWIPVTERLPEIDEKHHCSKDVLAYLKGGGMCFTALEENIFGQACFECERNPAVEEEMIVTHWMPLPEPPKEET